MKLNSLAVCALVKWSCCHASHGAVNRVKRDVYFKCLIYYPAHRKHSRNSGYYFNDYCHRQYNPYCHFQNAQVHTHQRENQHFLNVYYKEGTLSMSFHPSNIPKSGYDSLPFTGEKEGSRMLKKNLSQIIHVEREREPEFILKSSWLLNAVFSPWSLFGILIIQKKKKNPTIAFCRFLLNF